MGAGLARDLKELVPHFPKLLGRHIKAYNWLAGAIGPITIKGKSVLIYAFPTKFHWKQQSSLVLIKRSAFMLSYLAHYHRVFAYDPVYLPHVGCGLGRLSWNDQVRPILDEYLDDRFVAVSL